MSADAGHHDVVVVGGGHNGLVAAAYLARAGLSVQVLERLDHVGGAAVSAAVFPGVPTRISRYSSLVSLMPEPLMADLGLDITLRSRRTASYTPTLRDGRPGGLLVERIEREETRRSFVELTGSDDEYDAWRAFHADVAALAAVVAPTLLEPLPAERDLRERVDPDTWRDVVTTPLGVALERRFRDDTVRGLVAIDALVGTFASLHDPTLVQNRCFLHHVVGNGTGERRVPVGGMGAVTDALHRAAVEAGAEIVTGAGVGAVRAGEQLGDGAEVEWTDASGGRHLSAARCVLANVAPWVLRILRGQPEDADTKPAGAQLTIHLLLERLPRLRSGVDPAVAFSGTVRLGEDYAQLQAAFDDASAGRVPTSMPGEAFCHSLTDPTILGEVPVGTHTLTYVGRHTPAWLFDHDPEAAKTLAIGRAVASLDQHLLDPIATCVARDEHGHPCVEAQTPQEVERDLAMPGGHVFHGDLDWPWAPGRALLDTPARQWGVQTDVEPVMLCGSGARRGGGVSGIGGHNAAHAVLASL